MEIGFEREPVFHKRYKLVCTAKRDGSQIKARVAPEMVTHSDPLYAMEDSTTGAITGCTYSDD